MKYCPRLKCPHRLRLGEPAEFVDRMTACSDCQALLVGSEAEAIEGLVPVEGSPYRVARGSAGGSSSPAARATGDLAVGFAFLLGGLAFTVFSYASASPSGGRYLVAWAPMLYGIYRLVRPPRR